MNSLNEKNVNKGLSSVPKKASLISSLATNLRTTVALAALAASSLVTVKSATAQTPDYENTQACQGEQQICGPVRGASDSLTVSLGYQSTKNPFDAQALSAAARLTVPTGPDSDNLNYSPGLDFTFRAPLNGKRHSLELNTEYTLLHAEYGPNEHVGRGHLAYRYQDRTWFFGVGGGFMEMVSPFDGQLFAHVQAGLKAQDLIVTLGADIMEVDNYVAGYARASYKLSDQLNVYVQGSRGFFTNSENDLDSQFSAMGGLQFTFDTGQINTGIRGGHHVFSQNGFDTSLGGMFMTPKPEQPTPVHGNSYFIHSYTVAQDLINYLNTQERNQIITVDFGKLDMLKGVLFSNGAPTIYKDKVSSLKVDFANTGRLTSTEITNALNALAFLTYQGKLHVAPIDPANIPKRIKARINTEHRFRHLTRSFRENTELTGIHAHLSQIASNPDTVFPNIHGNTDSERVFYESGKSINARHAHFINGQLFEVKPHYGNFKVRFIKNFSDSSLNITADILEAHRDHAHTAPKAIIEKISSFLMQNPDLSAIVYHHDTKFTFDGYRGEFYNKSISLADTQLRLRKVGQNIYITMISHRGVRPNIIARKRLRPSSR